MNPSTNLLVALLILISSTLLCEFLMRGRIEAIYRRAAFEVCDLVESQYYLSNTDEVRSFARSCRAAAGRQKFLPTKEANIQRLNQRLSMIRTSHLSVYSPSETRQMWENQGLDTGIRSRLIDAQLVVHHVVPNSPAERAGIKTGDSLLTLNGQVIPSGTIAQTASGVFRIARRAKGEFSFEIRPEILTEDLSPSLENLGGGRGVLKIPSFLSQYFEDHRWQPIVRELQRYRSLAIDLRDNPGGSFPGMLRALSPFRCRDEVIGRIFRNSQGSVDNELDLQDDLRAESQLRRLAEAPRIRLRTFANYGCFSGPVAVLVDSGTSSVAEIFAQALMARAHTRVLGQPTAGQVVMAKWFPIATFGGEDFLISIPIAGYLTASGETLEERGVHPQAFLEYDLDRSLSGRDSWLEDAFKQLISANNISN